MVKSVRIVVEHENGSTDETVLEYITDFRQALVTPQPTEQPRVVFGGLFCRPQFQFDVVGSLVSKKEA